MNRMLLLALVAVSLIKTTQCVKATPGLPVPHAEVLDGLLSKFLGDSYSNNALFNFIMGKPSQHQNNSTGDNLDIRTLDVNNLRKIIAFAKKKYMNAIMEGQNSRRHYYVYPSWDGLFFVKPYVINKTIDLMQHSIYMVHEKINETRPFRKKYQSFNGYQIALLYGASETIIHKMELLWNQMKTFWKETHFVWYLILYEKIMQCSIDISDSIEKLFMIQYKHEEIRGAMDSAQSTRGSNLTKEQLRELMRNPDKAREMGISIPKGIN